MLNRILSMLSIGVALLVFTLPMENASAQVVVGGRTYVQVPNGIYFYGYNVRPMTRYTVGYPYSYYPYYVPFVQQPYYPPYGTHYYPYPSYYYAPYPVRYGYQRNYRRW